MRSPGNVPEEEQVIEILRRIDKDDDGRIKYEEFVEALQPVSLGFGSTIKSRKAKRTTENIEPSTQHRGDLFRSDRDLDFKKSRTATSTFRTTSPLKQTKQFSPEIRENKVRFYSPEQKLYKSTQKSQQLDDIYAEKTFLDQEKAHLKRSKSAQKKTTTKTSKTKNRSKIVLEENALSSLLIVFKELINLEREVEFVKQDLALRPDFNLMDAFRLFDNRAKGIITVKEFENIFRAFDLYPEKSDLYLLIKRLDRDGDGKLKYGFFRCQTFYIF